MSTATKPIIDAKLLGLTDVKGIWSRIGNCEPGVVQLVIVDVLVGEVWDPDVDAIDVSVGRFNALHLLTLGEM